MSAWLSLPRRVVAVSLVLAAVIGALAITSVAPASAAATAFPTAQTTGLPAGWTPRRVVTGDLWIRTPGAVVEDVRVVGGTIFVAAPGITLRRIEGIDSAVENEPGRSCNNGLVIEDSRFLPGATRSETDPPTIGTGGYTLRNVVIDGVAEGARVGGAYTGGCGPVTIEGSYIRVVAPAACVDWHGDGIQGYEGAPLTVRSTTVVMVQRDDCGGTAPFFYPADQGNASVDIDGLLVIGGGFPFRNGMPGAVRNLHVAQGSWVFGPVDVDCSLLSTWDATVSTVDAQGQPHRGASIDCPGAPTVRTDGAMPVFRFYSPALNGHFYTINAAERDHVMATLSGLWRYEGVAYYAYASARPGTIPLYRFWSPVFTGHFFTVNQAERDQVEATMPDLWTYEGIAYYVLPATAVSDDTVAVSRFWSPSAHHHFYTANAAERDWVSATLASVWTYEGDEFRIPR